MPQYYVNLTLQIKVKSPSHFRAERSSKDMINKLLSASGLKPVSITIIDVEEENSSFPEEESELL